MLKKKRLYGMERIIRIINIYYRSSFVQSKFDFDYLEYNIVFTLSILSKVGNIIKLSIIILYHLQP